MLKNVYLDAKLGVDTAENEPRKDCREGFRATLLRFRPPLLRFREGCEGRERLGAAPLLRFGHRRGES